MSAAATTTMTTTAAVSRRNSNAVGQRGLVFFVEDVEGRQADVRDFFLAQKNSSCIVL
jgi:hypothetical protein